MSRQITVVWFSISIAEARTVNNNRAISTGKIPNTNDSKLSSGREYKALIRSRKEFKIVARLII